MRGVVIYLSLGVLLIYLWLLGRKVVVGDLFFEQTFLTRKPTPTDEFIITPKRCFNWEMVTRGYELGLTKRLLIVSLVRNCEKSLEYMGHKLAALNRVYKNITVVFFENNSSDGTRTRLLDYSLGRKSWGEGIKVRVVNPFTFEENDPVCKSNADEFMNHDKTGIQGAGTKRISRMTYLRNRSLEWIRQHQHDYDVLLTTDMDIIGRIFPTGIAETLGMLSSIKDVGFIGFRGFFRGGGFFDPFSYKGRNRVNEHPLITLASCMSSYYLMPHGEGLQPVGSSHSGGAFINLPLPRDISYEVKKAASLPVFGDICICEHIPFQEKVANNFVNTNMTFLVKSNV